MAGVIGPTVPVLGLRVAPAPFGLLASLPREYLYDAGSFPISPHNEDETTVGPAMPGLDPDLSNMLDGQPTDTWRDDFFVGQHWESAFQFEPEHNALTLTSAGDFPYYWDCPEGAGATFVATSSTAKKKTQRPSALRRYRPYVAYAGDSATLVGYEARDRAARARRVLEGNLSRILEFELWTGTIAQVAGFPNDYFMNTPTALNGGATTGYLRSLAELEQAIIDTDQGPGMIHAQPRLVALWAAEKMLYPVPGTKRVQTLLGTTVIPGTGYPGTGTGVASVDSTSTTCWAYATDMVRVAMSASRVVAEVEGVGTVDASTVDYTINDAIYRAERTVAAFWDGSVKAGIKVNLASK